jgi:hypothetical protein
MELLMKNLRKLLIIGTVLSVAASPVLAQGRGGGGGGGGGVGAGVGAGANVGGQSGVNGRFGGQSEANIGAQGSVNSNGPNAADRAFGGERATSRAAEAQTRNSVTAQERGSSDLGSLNAARASENAQANAAAGSRVGEIATYESRMRSALAITDQARRNAAITDARQQLAQTTNKPLTAGAIAQLDSELAIQGASPQLGAQ